MICEGGSGVIELPAHPHAAADTTDSLRSCMGLLGDSAAPWGCRLRLEFEFLPTQRRIHPSPSSPAWAVWGIGTPCGGRSRMIEPPAPPQATANTPESLSSCPGRLGDRDAPWGCRVQWDFQFPSTQRRLHLSPPATAWAVWGIRMVHGGVGCDGTCSSSPHSGRYNRIPPVLPGLFGG